MGSGWERLGARGGQGLMGGEAGLGYKQALRAYGEGGDCVMSDRHMTETVLHT